MSTTVSVREARDLPADRRWIESVYRQYLNEIAPASTGLFPLLGEYGQREPDLVGLVFGDRSAKVFTILYGAEQAGFAVMRRRPRSAARGEEYTLAEFFVATPWRRRGVGQAAARLIFERFAGHWHISENARNTVALRFWKRVVSDYSGGRYQESREGGEIHQHFESTRNRSAR